MSVYCYRSKRDILLGLKSFVIARKRRLYYFRSHTFGKLLVYHVMHGPKKICYPFSMEYFFFSQEQCPKKIEEINHLKVVVPYLDIYSLDIIML